MDFNYMRDSFHCIILVYLKKNIITNDIFSFVDDWYLFMVLALLFYELLHIWYFIIVIITAFFFVLARLYSTVFYYYYYFIINIKICYNVVRQHCTLHVCL